jgi:hypothetical protein
VLVEVQTREFNETRFNAESAEGREETRRDRITGSFFLFKACIGAMNRGRTKAGNAPQPWQAATKTLARNPKRPKGKRIIAEYTRTKLNRSVRS